MTAPVPTSAGEWEYGTKAAFVADATDVFEELAHASLSDAQEYADARNAEEPHPNLFDDDDIELIWTVVRRRPASDVGPWIPAGSETPNV